jgi:hypothetical protein
MPSESDNESTFKPGRRLCPDGSCIGIIAGDGQCTVCGKTDTGSVGSYSPGSYSPDPGGDESMNEAAVEPNEPENAEAPAGFDPNRRLCSDDECIGVIGEDNRCGLCGKPAAP